MTVQDWSFFFFFFYFPAPDCLHVFPSSTHTASSHLEVVDEPGVVELRLLRVDRFWMDTHLAIGLGVHLDPGKEKTFVIESCTLAANWAEVNSEKQYSVFTETLYNKRIYFLTSVILHSVCHFQYVLNTNTQHTQTHSTYISCGQPQPSLHTT